VKKRARDSGSDQDADSTRAGAPAAKPYPQPSTVNPQPSNLNPKTSTLNPKHAGAPAAKRSQREISGKTEKDTSQRQGAPLHETIAPAVPTPLSTPQQQAITPTSVRAQPCPSSGSPCRQYVNKLQKRLHQMHHCTLDPSKVRYEYEQQLQRSRFRCRSC
jgi:hypothetical protein